MSVRKEYEEYLKRQNKLKNTKTGKFWTEQESRYVEPFCIYGNLYYVGDSWGCVHTVETGDAAGVLDTHIETKVSFAPTYYRFYCAKFLYLLIYNLRV